MVCIICHNTSTRVTNSRDKKRSPRVWRRRQCDHCSSIFTTTEVPEYESLVLIKRNGTKQPFSRPKLFISIWRACEPVGNSQNVAEELTKTVFEKLFLLPDASALSTEQVADVIMSTLKQYDTGSFLRYATYQTNLRSTREVKRALSYF